MAAQVGPVNFYYTVRGERRCRPMSTGESCLITPYVPHSFASRDLSQYSAIVAVTFSTGVREVLNQASARNVLATRFRRIAEYALCSAPWHNALAAPPPSMLLGLLPE